MNMARRRTTRKTTTRRPRKQAFNVLGAAESLILANAATRGVFGTNLIPFLTEGWLRPVTAGSSYGSGNSWRFSAKELVQYAMGDKSHMSQEWAAKGIGEAVKFNLKANGAESLMTMIAVPIAFRLGKQVLSKPRREANKLLKMSGIGNVVKV